MAEIQILKRPPSSGERNLRVFTTSSSLNLGEKYRSDTGPVKERLATVFPSFEGRGIRGRWSMGIKSEMTQFL